MRNGQSSVSNINLISENSIMAPKRCDEPICHEEQQLHDYKYYNACGVFTDKSRGSQPDPILFQKAHYVICNESKMIKNQDPVAVVKRDIARYRSELLAVPISHMEKIMELNHLIKNLEQFIEPETNSAAS